MGKLQTTFRGHYKFCSRRTRDLQIDKVTARFVSCVSKEGNQMDLNTDSHDESRKAEKPP